MNTDLGAGMQVSPGGIGYNGQANWDIYVPIIGLTVAGTAGPGQTFWPGMGTGGGLASGMTGGLPSWGGWCA